MGITGRLRARVQAGLTAVGSIPALVPILFDDRVRSILRRVPGSGSLYGSGWHRKHPFDRSNGTDTGGCVSIADLPGTNKGDAALAHASLYGGSQPSVVRAALDTLPDVSGSTFIDLGCGKGRVTLVAAERPFRQVVGVELSPDLARVAQANADIMAARYPGRPRVRIEAADASAYPIPSGDVVIFLYDPFGADLMAKVVAAVERAIQTESRALYVVYCNPVSGHLFDASPLLRRRWARMFPYAPDERGYGPELDDAIVVWQGGTAPPSAGPVDMAPIRLIPGRRAELAT